LHNLVIAISGKAGSGKTTHARKLAEIFSLRYVSNGMLFRQLANDLGVSFKELHRMAEKDPSIDKLVDERAREEAKKGNVVIEGHLACWLLRDLADLCIIFTAPLEERARRIAEREGRDFEEVLAEIRLREASNRARAKKYYGVDLEDWSVADLVVNTYRLLPDSVDRVLTIFVLSYLEEKKLNLAGASRKER